MNVKALCIGKKRIYFKDKGYLCSGEKGKKEDVKNSTIVKHGLLQEESFPRRRFDFYLWESWGKIYNPKLRREKQ